MNDSKSTNTGKQFNPDDIGKYTTSRLSRLNQTGIPYHTLPKDLDTPTYADKPWKIILEPVDLMVQPLGLTLHDTVIVGVSESGMLPIDVNLVRWQGRERGVSRRHLAITPSVEALMVDDLDSTNGTHLNGSPLEPGTPEPLTDGALLALGLLLLRVLFVKQPLDS